MSAPMRLFFMVKSIAFRSFLVMEMRQDHFRHRNHQASVVCGKVVPGDAALLARFVAELRGESLIDVVEGPGEFLWRDLLHCGTTTSLTFNTMTLPCTLAD